MKTGDVKAVVDCAKELGESCGNVAQAARGSTCEVEVAKKLWRANNKSTLIKVGLALIAFPDPTISDVVGSALVAAGVVQQGIRRHALYVDDVGKMFQKALREIQQAKHNI